MEHEVACLHGHTRFMGCWWCCEVGVPLVACGARCFEVASAQLREAYAENGYLGVVAAVFGGGSPAEAYHAAVAYVHSLSLSKRLLVEKERADLETDLERSREAAGIAPVSAGLERELLGGDAQKLLGEANWWSWKSVLGLICVALLGLACWCSCRAADGERGAAEGTHGHIPDYEGDARESIWP